jgi:hypothetical protein
MTIKASDMSFTHWVKCSVPRINPRCAMAPCHSGIALVAFGPRIDPPDQSALRDGPKPYMRLAHCRPTIDPLIEGRMASGMTMASGTMVQI